MKIKDLVAFMDKNCDEGFELHEYADMLKKIMSNYDELISSNDPRDILVTHDTMTVCIEGIDSAILKGEFSYEKFKI